MKSNDEKEPIGAKDSVTTPVEVKRKRGRPAKPKDATALQAAPVVKRGRGRPRAVAKPSEGPEEKKKQLGRSKRRRARKDLQGFLDRDPAFKRRRGRPAIARPEPQAVGRPVGSTDPVMAPELKMSINEFSAVRAYLQGIDCMDIFAIYFPHEQQRPSGESPALTKIISLLRLLLSAATSRRGDDVAGELEGTTQAISTLQARLAEAETRRLHLLAKAKGEREARVVRQPNPIPAKLATSVLDHLVSVDAYIEWYITENLDGIDPELGVSEWVEKFSEATNEHNAALPQSAPSPDGHAASEDEDVLVHLSPPDGAAYSALFYGAQSLAPKTGFIPDDIESSLKALEWMRSIVARPALNSDLVDLYFTAVTVRQLKAAEIFTLYQLTHLVNRRGRMWWTEVHGLGRKRAAKVNEWLCTAGVDSGLEIRTDLAPAPLKAQLEQKQRSDKKIPAALLKYGLGPLALLSITPELDGSRGTFRKHGENMLEAQTDIEAVVAAFTKYNDYPRTQTVYGRELCRFMRWCILEKKKPLSSVSMPDAREYKEFLDDLPQSWINPAFVLKGADSWTSFRGQLRDASKRKALTAISVIYGQLASAGYLTGNPMAGVLKGSRLKAAAMDVTRSLSSNQWSHIENELTALPCLDQLHGAQQRAQALIDAVAEQNRGTVHQTQTDRVNSPNRGIGSVQLSAAIKTLQNHSKKVEQLHVQARRLRALLYLLQSTGIRREECFHARLGCIKAEVVDGSTSYLLTVVGKGNKQRAVMVTPQVMDIVMEHIYDRKAVGYVDDLASNDGRKKIPLISVIGKPVTTWTFDSQTPRAIANANIVSKPRELADESGSLSPEGMQRLAKSFLSKCAQSYPHAPDSDQFLNASLHWFRHTFGTTMANSGVDLRTIQRQMGHANINTTAQYSKKEDHEMIRELRAGHDAAAAAKVGVSRGLPPALLEPRS